ncbi:protein turtle-like isoform X3 [Ischnura elegans]|uniref:protein turtle-like isoform X3 n=1 Tax=Ischnura elegans TaxID=197161 RepID=UPI001ED89078|nr:protein turtle-like isoform X3 [Ischnura elegans]
MGSSVGHVVVDSIRRRQAVKPPQPARLRSPLVAPEHFPPPPPALRLAAAEDEDAAVEVGGALLPARLVEASRWRKDEEESPLASPAAYPPRLRRSRRRGRPLVGGGPEEEEQEEGYSSCGRKRRRRRRAGRRTGGCAPGVREATAPVSTRGLVSSLAAFLGLNLIALLAPSGLCIQDAVHITAILGESVVFNCHVEFPGDHPVPYVLQWEKKVGDTDVEIPIYIWYDSYPTHSGEGYEGRVSRVSPDSPYGLASLNLTGIRESDQGWYECKVVFLNRSPNQHKNGTWFHLDVHAPPRFSVTPEDIIYVNLGDAIILNCQAEGTPTPEILWYKDANPVEPSPTVGVFNDGTELRISSIRHEDIGDYTCIARNGEGQISHTARVIIAGGAVIMVPPTNQTKLEGEKAAFSCEAKALPGNVTVRWFREGVPVREVSALETRVTIRRDGSLVVNPVSADDSGLFLCEVTNGIGEPQSASAFLNVEYPAKVTFTPTVQYLPFRLAGVVQCYIKANPPLQYVTWTKDKRLLEPYQTKDIVIMNNGSLLFTRVNQNHQGRYTCTPYNAQGTQGSSGPMEVLVRKPPVFTLEPDSMYQRKIGESVEMVCDAQEAEGTQKPSIVWQRRDGSALQRNRVRMSGGNMTIENLRRTDFGFYQCVASNEVATIVTATQLVVEGTQPHAPYNVSANASEFAVTLLWLPGYSGGPDYKQDYTIWYREGGVSDWSTIPVTPPGSTQVTINRLSPGTTYEFQVVGKNALGDGMFSKVISVRTRDIYDYSIIMFPTDSTGATLIPPVLRPKGPKPGPPRNLTVSEVSNGFLITWQAPLERSNLIQYYTIKYRTDAQWKTLNKGQIRPEETSYLVKNLVGGRTYYFRVYANSVKNYESSDEIKFPVPARVKHKAITAGVVGGILFFIVAIILSICAVKICNKRKRRKQEKAYNMVACRITDARNGGQPPGASQVPLKKLRQSRIPSVTLGAFKQIQTTLGQLTRAWVTLKPIGSRRAGEANWSSSHERQHLEEEECSQRSPPRPPQHPHPPSPFIQPPVPGAFQHLHVPHPHPPLHPYYPHLHRSESLEKALAAGQSSRPPVAGPPFLRPLNRISRAPDGRFVVDASSSSDEGGFIPRPSWRRPRPRPIFPRPRPLPLVAPGSPPFDGRASLRSDGSGESCLIARRVVRHHPLPHPGHPVHPSPVGPPMITVPATIYTPHFRASSPGPMASVNPQSAGGDTWFTPTPVHNFSELSSVRQASSVDRSLPTTAATHSGLSGLNSSSLRSVHARYAQELPSLRAIHEENGRWQWVRAEVHQHHHPTPHQLMRPGHAPPPGPIVATTPLTHRRSGRHIHGPAPSLLLHHPIHPHALLPRLAQQPPRPMAGGHPPSHLRVAIPSNNQVPGPPMTAMPQAASKHHMHPSALGAQSGSGRMAPGGIPRARLPSRLHSRPPVAASLRHSRSAPELGSAENYAASLRASLASGSSRGSQRVHPPHVVVGRPGAAPELLHEASPESRSSSSGFGSKNTSQQNQSSHSGQSPLDGSSISAEWRGAAPLLQPAMPMHHHHHLEMPPVVELARPTTQPGPPYRPPPPPPPPAWMNPRQARPQFATASPAPLQGMHFVPHHTRGAVPPQEAPGWPPPPPSLELERALLRGPTVEREPYPSSPPRIPLPPPPPSPITLPPSEIVEPPDPEAPDVSVDDHYEFDTVLAADGTPLPGTPNQRSIGGSISGFGGSAGGMSDSEIYSSFYPRPNKPSKYENMEARVQAMKEEFHAYRQRQAKKKKGEEMESAC